MSISTSNGTGYNIHMYKGKMALVSKDAATQKLYAKVLNVFDADGDKRLDGNELRNIWKKVESADYDKDGEITAAELDNLIKSDKNLAKSGFNGKSLEQFIQTINKTLNAKYTKNINRTISNIEKQYPKNKYTIEYSEYGRKYFNVLDKKGNVVSKYDVDVDGSYTKTQNNGDRYEYDANGKLLRYERAQDKHVHNTIADSLYKDITAKTALGFPTTGKDFEKHIMQITPENVFDVLIDYAHAHNETLLDAINSEWGLDKKVKERVLKHLNKCVTAAGLGPDANCKIDEDFSQGKTGDCWFLATIESLRNNPKGRQILNSMITKNSDGSYTVKFKGADKAYTITPLEFFCSNLFMGGELGNNKSFGDDDVQLLELAAKKHFKYTGISGGNPATAFKLLLGKGSLKNDARTFLNIPAPYKLKKILNNPHIAVTASTSPVSTVVGDILSLVTGKNDNNNDYREEIFNSHAYAVTGMDDKYVYIKNPHDTEKTIKVPVDNFCNYFRCLQYEKI